VYDTPQYTCELRELHTTLAREALGGKKNTEKNDSKRKPGRTTHSLVLGGRKGEKIKTRIRANQTERKDVRSKRRAGKKTESAVSLC